MPVGEVLVSGPVDVDGLGLGDPDVDVGVGSSSSSSVVDELVGVSVTVGVGSSATTKVTVVPCSTVPDPGLCSRMVPGSSPESRDCSSISRLRSKTSERTSAMS